MSKRPAMLRHRLPEPTPVRMIGKNGPVSLQLVADILAMNAKIAGNENGKQRARRRRRN